ncbi:MAG: AfsR/SARP family transcriptional regulator, partial [Ktedonobacteraceae bacterium]
MAEQQQVMPAFRVFLCGGFRVERRTGTCYEALHTVEWSRSNYPRLLLKALLCCRGREARREALLDMLWPDGDGEQAVQYLNSATTKLRKVLESLLITESDATVYRLEGQETLWVDVDAAFAVQKDIEGQGRTSLQALSLLETAVALFQKGTFLQDEEGQWAATRRATVEQTRYRYRIWLAEAYEQQGKPGQAESVLSLLLEEDPTDEDVLCRLMNLLHQQGMTHQALRVYHRVVEACTQDGLDLAETTKTLASQLRKAHHLPPTPLYDRIEVDTVHSHRTTEPTAQPKVEISHVPLPNTGQDTLYMLTERQLLNFAAVSRLGEPMMFDPTKRQTLETLLATLSMAMVQPQGLLQTEAWKALLTPTM